MATPRMFRKHASLVMKDDGLAGHTGFEGTRIMRVFSFMAADLSGFLLHRDVNDRCYLRLSEHTAKIASARALVAGPALSRSANTSLRTSVRRPPSMSGSSRNNPLFNSA